MYKQHFGLTEKPFNTTPDPRYFFASEKHSEALNSLIYAINERKGFVVITGEIGAGKTTISRALLTQCDLTTKVALITNTHLTARELITEILNELEVDYKPGSKHKLLGQLNNYLVSQLALDVNVVLIIDEAQNLTPKVLEEVRMLSNLETEREKLIQIILLGQPQLKAKLEHPGLAQFKQRIAVYYHLQPLTQPETREYIKHRLKLAGSSGPDIFTEESIELIYTYSGGIPRLINLVCDSALLSAYAFNTRVVDRAIIEDVIKERNLGAGTASKDTPGAQPVTTHCCPQCGHHMTCEIKWDRGLNGEEQLCCPRCSNYDECIRSGGRICR